MQKIILVILKIHLMTSQDLVKGIDITGLSTVTGSQINQTVDVARPASDKGLVIVTTDTALSTPVVPDPNIELESVTPTHWTRYVWIRKGFNNTVRPKLYVWDDNATSHATYLKWYEVIADVATIQSAVDDLETRMAEVEADVTAVETQATNAVNSANQANTAADQANDTANAAQAGVTNNATAIASLDTRLDTVEAEITKTSSYPTVADKILYSTAEDVWAETTLTSFIRTLLDDVDASTARNTLGILSNLRHEEALYTFTPGGDGGATTGGAYQTIPLNVEAYDTGNNGTLVGNEITLAAGTYRYEFLLTGHRCNKFKGRLYNVTDAAAIAQSVSAVAFSDTATFSSSNPNTVTHTGRFTIASAKAIRLEGYYQTARATDGLGVSISADETFAWLKLVKE